MDRAIKILFSDIGGVLISDGWGHKSRQKAAKKFNLALDEIERLHNFIFNIYEIGRITLDQYLDIVIFNRERNFTREDFKAFIFAQSVELPGMLHWLKQWKRDNPGIKIFSINNEGRELNDYRIEKFELHKCFDAFISSGEVGMRKPDPGIFELALSIVKVPPEQCIYFDDRQIIVEAAQRLRIRGYHHESFESTKKILEAIKPD